MRLALASLRAWGVAAVTAVALAACGSDNTAPPPQPPAAPANLRVTVNLTNIVVQWDAVTDATSYRLERADPSTPGVFTQLGGGNITGTSFTDNNVTAGVQYSYRVAAINANGTSPFSSTVTSGLRRRVVSGFISSNQSWSADTTYELSGFVKVISGAQLTIAAGTRIVGDTSVAGSSLWITRGSRIIANGTAAAPIVFTSERSAPNRRPGDWGGIVIVGNGVINRTGAVLTEGPQGVAENYAGGTNNADNSGTLRYVRVEFAGFDVSGGGNSELNTFSFYAVGSGTTLEYLQSVAALDDAFEWWGGAVDARYLVAYETNDDMYDMAEGYVGRLQYLIGYDDGATLPPAVGTGVAATDPQGFEIDGCAGSGCGGGTRSLPFTDPIVLNWTIVGNGNSENQTAGGRGGVWRRGTLGLYSNGILARWPSNAISIRDTSVTLFDRDSLVIANVVAAQFGARGGTEATLFEPSSNPAYTAAQFVTKAAGLNIRTATNATDVLTNLAPASLNFLQTGIATSGCSATAIPARWSGRLTNFFGGTLALTSFCGAVDPANANWYQGWTVYLRN